MLASLLYEWAVPLNSFYSKMERSLFLNLIVGSCDFRSASLAGLHSTGSVSMGQTLPHHLQNHHKFHIL